MNKNGGGIYALEWDPANGYIKSWVFKRDAIPENLRGSIDRASIDNANVVPNPDTWPLPYAYFAIGENSCSADHFRNMRLVINTAFCGQVSGNRFSRDCPELFDEFNTNNDPVLTCNAYIEAHGNELTEAYWKIRGVYIYERKLVHKNGGPVTDQEVAN